MNLKLNPQATQSQLISGVVLILLSLVSMLASMYSASKILIVLIFFFGVWGGVETGRYLEFWLGILPNYLVTLEVLGRRSGKLIRFPLVMTLKNGERYLVSMLGEDANWARNVRAAGGIAKLRHGKVEAVILEEVEIPQRAAIIKEYLRIAPGGRSHFPVSRDALFPEFEKIASKYPVFRLRPRTN